MHISNIFLALSCQLILKDEKNWKLSLDQAVLDLNNEFEDNIICLVTYQSFYKEGFIANVKKCETAKAIICDDLIHFFFVGKYGKKTKHSWSNSQN